MPAIKARKKPVEIEAFRFETNNETDDRNMNDICIWANQGKDEPPLSHNGTDIFIKTLEGTMRATCGDWIIKGVKGEFYPCKPEIFDATYDIV